MSGPYNVNSLSSDKASLESPTFTGNVNAPTPGLEDDSTRVATTAFVQSVATGGSVTLNTNQTLTGVKTFEPGMLKGNGTVGTLGSGFSAIINTTEKILLASIVTGGSSRNYTIKGSVTAHASANRITSDFEVVIRADTLPSKTINLRQTRRDRTTTVDRFIDIEVWEDTASDLTHIVAVPTLGSGTLQNMAWSVDVFMREAYGLTNITLPTTKTVQSTAGLTNVPRVWETDPTYSQTLFGKLEVRDRDFAVAHGENGYITAPTMGQVMRLDASALAGQVAFFLSNDQREPVISPEHYVGLHTRNNNTTAAPSVWGMNPVVVKDIKSTTAPGGKTHLVGMEISVSNNTDEAAEPLRDDSVEGMFISYIHTQNYASAALTTGGLEARWNNGLWLDGIRPTVGRAIVIADDVSAGAGMDRGLDTTRTTSFSQGAITLGNNHSIQGATGAGVLGNLIKRNGSNECEIGGTGAWNRITGSGTVVYGTFQSFGDGTSSCGSIGNRWSVVYATTGTINTSDEREKQDIRELSDIEKAVAAKLKGLIKVFRWKDSVIEKGDDARIHVGVIAQEVISAFQSEGLDPFQYGIVCFNELEALEEIIDDEGNTLQHEREATDRYGIRYDQLLAFIISTL